VLIIRRSKLYYTASGIITLIGVMIPDEYCDKSTNVVLLRDMVTKELGVRSKTTYGMEDV